MDVDVIVVGGSFAGLSAAIYLGRANRTVCVLDTGAPRNRFAAASHGFFAQDGADPRTLLAAMRSQVAAYETVGFLDRAAVAVRGAIETFAVTLEDGQDVTGRRLVLAHGLVDDLPPLEGLAERWGRSVIHCPYCHGFEFTGRRLGVLRRTAMSGHQAMLVSEWGPTTYFLDGGDAPDAETAAELARRGIAVEPSPVARLEGEGDALAALVLADGRREEIDALYVAPQSRFSSDLAAQLGCRIEETPMGPIVFTDAQRASSVAGVFAAGDIVAGGQSIAFSVADGVMAGTAAHRSLVFPDR